MQSAERKMQNAERNCGMQRAGPAPLTHPGARPGALSAFYLPQSTFCIPHSGLHGYSAISPSLKRAKRPMVMFSPVLATALAIICETLTEPSRTES
jgi:hypothetical protein